MDWYVRKIVIWPLDMNLCVKIMESSKLAQEHGLLCSHFHLGLDNNASLR